MKVVKQGSIIQNRRAIHHLRISSQNQASIIQVLKQEILLIAGLTANRPIQTGIVIATGPIQNQAL
jgi:hypothetical protein